MTVGEMLGRMSSSEFAEWAAYYRIEPWGESRDDLRAGTIAAPIYNALTGAKRKPSEWQQTFGSPGSPEEVGMQNDEEMKTLLQGFTEACKARGKKKKPTQPGRSVEVKDTTNGNRRRIGRHNPR